MLEELAEALPTEGVLAREGDWFNHDSEADVALDIDLILFNDWLWLLLDD